MTAALIVPTLLLTQLRFHTCSEHKSAYLQEQCCQPGNEDKIMPIKSTGYGSSKVNYEQIVKRMWRNMTRDEEDGIYTYHNYTYWAQGFGDPQRCIWIDTDLWSLSLRIVYHDNAFWLYEVASNGIPYERWQITHFYENPDTSRSSIGLENPGKVLKGSDYWINACGDETTLCRIPSARTSLTYPMPCDWTGAVNGYLPGDTTGPKAFSDSSFFYCKSSALCDRDTQMGTCYTAFGLSFDDYYDPVFGTASNTVCSPKFDTMMMKNFPLALLGRNEWTMSQERIPFASPINSPPLDWTKAEAIEYLSNATLFSNFGYTASQIDAAAELLVDYPLTGYVRSLFSSLYLVNVLRTQFKQLPPLAFPQWMVDRVAACKASGGVKDTTECKNIYPEVSSLTYNLESATFSTCDQPLMTHYTDATINLKNWITGEELSQKVGMKTWDTVSKTAEGLATSLFVSGPYKQGWTSCDNIEFPYG